MTALDLDAIKARAEAATPGPWVTCSAWDTGVWMGDEQDHETTSLHPSTYAEKCRDIYQRNAEFIVAARSDIPALVAEVEALRRWKAEAITVIAAWEEVHDALGFPGELGQTKSEAALAAVERLRAERDTLTALDPTTVLALVAEVEALRAENEALREMRDAAQDDAHEAWLSSSRSAIRAECDALQARIEAALVLCDEWEPTWAADLRAALSPQEGT